MGALAGIRVLEFAGIGPGPFCGMLLADLGADVIRLDRPTGSGVFSLGPEHDVIGRGRRSVAIDLKHPESTALVLRLLERSDALIEGYRPGVMERLGLGPEICLERNPRLIYGRVTGWGQDGPLRSAAGHDLNYIALTGALHAIGPRGGPPIPPLNLIGDYGGGGMLLALGVLAALVERGSSGRGQVVDAAMVDGSALLMALFYGLRAAGLWGDARGEQLLDGGAPFYQAYETRDGKHVAIGALEPAFYGELLERLEIPPAERIEQHDLARREELRQQLAARFRTRTRDEWCALLEGSDACFAPVLSLEEAPHHPQMQARATFTERAGVAQPSPAPRLSRTPAQLSRPSPRPGEHTRTALTDWGVDDAQITALIRSGALLDARE